MAILRTLPAAVAVAALTATLVGCGNSDVRDERDQAQMERDQALMERDEAQTGLDQAQMERDKAQSELDQAQSDLEEAQAERDAAQTEADRLAMDQKEKEDAAAAAEAARQAAIMAAKDALMTAKDALMALPADASYENMLAAEMAVVAAAQGVVDVLVANDASHEEIVAAMEPVTMHQANIDAIQMKIDAAAEADQMMAHRMRVLDLVGASARAALGGAHGRLNSPGGVDGADDDAISDADRALVWRVEDPTSADFDLDSDYGTTAVDQDTDTDNAPLFSVSVADKVISVGATNARAGAPGSATAPGAFSAADRDAPVIAGWTGMVHERSYVTDGAARATLSTGDDVNVTDMVTTYTNQEPTQGRFWNELFPPPGSPRDGQSDSVGAAAAVTAVQRGGRVVLNSTATVQPAASDGFPAANRLTYTYDGATTTPTNRPIANFVGSYRGVSGKFTCGDDGTAVDCVAARSATGVLSLSGAWRFTPDGDPAMIVIPGTNTDMDYMTFGYWVETTTDNNNGRTTYEVGTYNLHLGPATRMGDILATVTGSATYSGPAAGVFARRAYDPEGGGTVETAGRFTADAMLTADFDTTDSDISGTITNFMHAGEMIDPQWMVTMTEGDISLDGGDPAATDATNGGTFMSNSANQASGDGSVWSGMFHGHYQADDTNTPVNEAMLQPTGVSGRFANTFDNGEVLGAFAATR